MLCFDKYFYILLQLVLFSLSSQSQESKSIIPNEKISVFSQALDSLQVFYTGQKQVKVYQSCKIPSHASYFIVSSLKTFSGTALSLRERHRHSYINMYALMDMANDCYNRTAYDSATEYWLRALDTAIKFGFEAEELHGIRMALNNNCFLKGDYTGAMKISTEGLARAEEVADIDRMAHFNNVIGYIYMKLRDTAKAGYYFNYHLQNARSIDDTLEVAHALYNLGDLSIIKKDYEIAVKYFTESKNLYATIKNSQLFDHTAKEAYVCNKLAQCWKLKGDLDKALYFIRTSLAATAMRTSVNLYDKADYFINAGDIYNRMMQLDTAMVLLRKGLNIANSIHHQEFIRDAFEQIAISYSQQKRFDSAYAYQTRFSKLKDSIDFEISKEEIYQRDADLQMDRQLQWQQSAFQRQRLWRNIIIGISGLSMLTVFLLYNRYRLKQKNRYQKELNRQQIELFNAIAATQEQERKRIAQDIHDGLGSVLSAAKLKLAEVRDSKPELVDEKFISGINLLDEASSELRHISHNIMPATLSKLGLVPALKNLTEKISSLKGLQVHFIAHELNNRLDEQTEISIYRIILELINNVVKHAAATKATVQLIKYPDYINITVEDNGKGFDVVNEEKTGIGLGNVAARVEYLKGKLEIDTKPGKGTTIVVDIPFV